MRFIQVLMFASLFFAFIGTLNGQQSGSLTLSKEYEGKIYPLPDGGVVRTLYIFEKPSKAIVRKIVQSPGRNETRMLFNMQTERMEPTLVAVPPSSKVDDFSGTYTQQGNKIRITVADLTVEATIVSDGLEGMVTWKDGSKEEWAAIKISDSSETNSATLSNKYSAPIDSPILGTWKYQDGCTSTSFGGVTATSCNRTDTYIFSQDGNVQSIYIINLSPQTVIGNWKYTAEDKSSGVLEVFKDDKLVEKANVKFLGKSQLQYTITFSSSSDIIGKTYVWNKQ